MNTAAASAALPLLVIEDEPSVMSFLSAALQRAGYPMVPASSGAEGLQLLASGKFRGVISDMRTPGGVNGDDVHAWLVKNRPELVSRLVFITGDTVNEETLAILRRTGAPCVEKPFRVNQLIAVVEQVFGKAP